MRRFDVEYVSNEQRGEKYQSWITRIVFTFQVYVVGPLFVCVLNDRQILDHLAVDASHGNDVFFCTKWLTSTLGISNGHLGIHKK